MARLISISLVGIYTVVWCAGAQSADYQVLKFLITPEKATLHICSSASEELQDVRFECVADNAYDIEWNVDGVTKHPGHFTRAESVISVLSYQHNITNHDNDVEVFCIAWGLDRKAKLNITSQPATISVKRVVCDQSNKGDVVNAASQLNDTVTSLPIHQRCLPMLIGLVVSIIISVILSGVIIGLLINKYRRDDDDDIQRDSVRSSHSGGVAPNGSSTRRRRPRGN